MKHLLALPALALFAFPAFAEDLASDSEILAAVSGNTIEGGMSDGAVYSEFYDADGTIKADGYTGNWSVADNVMCFDYGEGASCFGLVIEGDLVTWMQDGMNAGTGTITAGNPNTY